MSDTTIQELQVCLDRLRKGDAAARDELINLACKRMTVLTRKMLNDYSRLRQWEQTDDVFQNSAMRLRRGLEEVSPGSVKEFFGLAALNIRRELKDLARHYFGRHDGEQEGEKREAPARSPIHANQFRGFDSDGNESPQEPQNPDMTFEAGGLAQWGDFHKAVSDLPEKDREIVDLLFYHELTQEAAAEVLGVDTSTVKRRWRAAKVKLVQLMQNTLPDM